MSQQRSYTFEELVEIYRCYAELKGWSTKDVTVRDKVEAWVDSRIGAVGLAIQFHENQTDGAKHLGRDAEARVQDASIQPLSLTLAGTEYRNSDGSSRPEIASHCSPLEVLRLRREPDNQFDSNAVGVFRKNGEQLGYLPRRIAAETVAQMKRGYKHAAVISAIKSSLKIVVDLASGQSTNPEEITITLFVLKPEVTTVAWEDYYRAWVAKVRDPVRKQIQASNKNQ